LDHSESQHTNRALLAEVVYHGAVAATALWLVLSRASWMALLAFGVVNVAGLGVFRSRLRPGVFLLRRNWEIGPATLVATMLTALPMLLELGTEPARTRGIIAAAIFLAVRVLLVTQRSHTETKVRRRRAAQR
jgi:hypothetical protein